MNIRLAGYEPNSIVDGPGIRFTIFAQGCPHNCLGCHNPQTHDFKGGFILDTQSIITSIFYNSGLIQGVTFSGGEPFCQPLSFLEIAKAVRKENLNVLCYTGYTYETLIQDKNQLELLKNIDFLIDGKFELTKKSLDLPFRGSTNQRFIDVPRSICCNEIIQFT